MKQKPSFDAILQFDSAPDSMLVDIPTAMVIINRSRASLYRDFKAGRLTTVKVGNSRRIQVGGIRRMIGAA